jgi:hypothetical protein
MYNTETQATLGTRQCFTKEALEKTKGTVSKVRMYNPEKQTTLGRRQCFTKGAFEKPKGAIKNVQYRDTGNNGHKTMFYNPETQATLGTRQRFTIQRHRQLLWVFLQLLL